MFIPLMKADAAQRLVYGSVDETPDRAKEVMDYATAKAAFQDWSGEMQKASDGKSFGNIRGQHSNIAAGKLDQEIVFNDEAKRIDFVARIVDDNEWRKVEEGVYTGFSPGGKYAKRWQDGENKRYTPVVRELSIVDIPCIPSATFTMVKADGVEEQVEFTLDKAYEPGNEATVERAETLAKAAGKPDRKNDFLVKARAELIAENADQALAKMADEPESDQVEETVENDPVAKLEASLAKAAAVSAPAVETTDVDVPEQFRDLAKVAGAMRAIGKSIEDQPILQKSMWTVERLGRLLERAGSIASDVAWEEKAENDTDSKLPQMAIDLVNSVKTFLIEMVNEETAELLAQINANMPEFTLVIVEDDDMALATSIVDLVKADTDLMEKAGKRNSTKDQTMIQTMHDHSVSLGATCDADAKKDALANLEADRDRLAKAVDSAVPQIEALTEKVEGALTALTETKGELSKASARIAELEGRPEMAKGAVFAVEKENDGAGPKPDAATPALSLVGQALQIAAKR